MPRLFPGPCVAMSSLLLRFVLMLDTLALDILEGAWGCLVFSLGPYVAGSSLLLKFGIMLDVSEAAQLEFSHR